MTRIKQLRYRIIEDVSALAALPFFAATIAALYVLKQELLATQILIGVIASYTITYAIRALYHKERPKHQAYTTHLEKIDASSFPSLHCMRAMMLVALVIALQISAIAIAALCIYAISIMLSRYYLEKHDTIDILGGAAIGLALGTALALLTAKFF